MTYLESLSKVSLFFTASLSSLDFQARGPAPSTSGDDVIDEAIAFFRANVLFRNFEVKGAADRLLVYLTLYIGKCLQREIFSLCIQDPHNDVQEIYRACTP